MRCTGRPFHVSLRIYVWMGKAWMAYTLCEGWWVSGAGTIHQAEALPGERSLHLTVSACQRTSWADFLAVALPRALELAAEEALPLRRALPRDLFSHLVCCASCIPAFLSLSCLALCIAGALADDASVQPLLTFAVLCTLVELLAVLS